MNVVNSSANLQHTIFRHLNGANNPNQSRTFHPLVGLFLLNLFARAVSAKYDSFLPYQLSFDPSTWWTSTKPSNNAAWSNVETYPETTYPDYTPTNPTYSNIYPSLTTSFPNQPPLLYANYDDYIYPEERKYRHIKKINQITASGDLITAESNVNARRRPSSGSKRARPSNRNKYSQKRRRTTTPAYYDSYEEEDYSVEKYTNRRKRPFDSNESYDDDQDENYYDSNENKRNRKRPNKNRLNNNINKNKNGNEFDSRETLQTEIVIVRQAATTTEPTTFITNGTESTATATTTNMTMTNNTTPLYGYGPSNGNEGISITYGPPSGQYQYAAPHIDWLGNDGTRNIIKRVRDVVGFQRKINVKK